MPERGTTISNAPDCLGQMQYKNILPHEVAYMCMNAGATIGAIISKGNLDHVEITK